jgi:hypothetical protein
VEERVASGVGNDHGIARLEAPPGILWGPQSIDVGREWHVLRWNRWGTDPERRLPLDARVPTRIVVWARHAFWLSGRVVDEAGRPLSGVTTRYVVPQHMPSGLVLGSFAGSTDEDGRFQVGSFAEVAGAGFSGPQRETLEGHDHITFARDGFATERLDPRSVPAEERNRVLVTLTRGAALAGDLVDVHGQPLADAVVAVEYGHIHDLRRGTRTDRSGRWRIDRLSPGRARLSARAFQDNAKAARDVVIEGDDRDVHLVATEIRLSRPPPTVDVLGLQLCDVDAEIRAAYEVPESVKVMIFDPGPNVWSLGIGHLERGYGLAFVGEERPASVRNAIELLLRKPGTPNDRGPERQRVVYTFWDERTSGSATHSIEMTDEMTQKLRETLDRSPR